MVSSPPLPEHPVFRFSGKRASLIPITTAHCDWNRLSTSSFPPIHHHLALRAAHNERSNREQETKNKGLKTGTSNRE